MNMNSPHVDTLSYKVKIAENTDYSNVSPFSKETDDFIFNMDSNLAKFKMKNKLLSIEEAEKLADEFLNNWKVFNSLNFRDEFSFDFSGAGLINDSGNKRELLCASAKMQFSIINEKMTRSNYPSIPENFRISDEVEIMHVQYNAYLQKQTRLLPMAYVCLTMLEAFGGGSRKVTANKYFIDFEVLNTLGSLCSEKGDKSDLRKYPKDGVIKPLTKEEKIWIEEAVRKIILRVGEYTFDPSKSMQIITMDDLPKM